MTTPSSPAARICTTQRFDLGNERAEHKTWWVFGLTLITMVVEIIAGLMTGSMALMADGWHMSSHALALGLAGGAYVLARRYAGDGRFAFGTWKIEVLASFASALLLAVVATLMVVESVQRLMHPLSIDYRDAMVVAVLGLLVNVASAWLLRGGAYHHDHGHAHGHHDHHDHDHAAHHGQGDAHHAHHEQHDGATPHHDLNLRGAYLHVLADAATSVAAIGALAGGMIWGWSWLDPVVGCVGAALIFIWSFGLLRESGTVLLDREMDRPLVAEIRDCLSAAPDTRVSDLHLWRVGREHYACVVSLQTNSGRPASFYRGLLAGFRQLAHITVEIEAI
jgi:cation diffusion facilitator family transporter